MPQLVEIGVLARPHGIRGEVCVHYFATSPKLLQGELYAQAGNLPPRPIRVTGLRMHHGQPIVTIEGVPDRSGAEMLRGQRLLIPEEVLPPTEEDEHYIYELIEYEVFDKTSEARLGRLDHVLFYGEQETWVILDDAKKEILLPAVPQFVDSIDDNTRRILVSPPEGLLELYGVTR